MIRFFNFVFYVFLVIFNHHSAHANNFAYLIVESQTGKILASHRADEIRPPASLTKKMTLYLVFDALRKGKISLDTKFSVSKLATKQEPCNLWLKTGDTISVKNIIYALITRSANDMSIVIAEGIGGSVENFVSLMNKKARELGMTRTKFCNPTGLPNRKQVTTARDMMALSCALYNKFPYEFKYFKTKKFFYNGKPILNHNRMLNSFAGADGIKTGFTNASRFNISVSAERRGINGKPIRVFAVVLGGQTSFSRDRKAAELMEKAFKKLNATPKMQTVSASSDSIDTIITEKNLIRKKKSKASSQTNPKQKKKAISLKEVKSVQTAISAKDPIDEILSTTARISINNDLPVGWVKPKLSLKKS